jgi:hypothetical protein
MVEHIQYTAYAAAKRLVAVYHHEIPRPPSTPVDTKPAMTTRTVRWAIVNRGRGSRMVYLGQ